MASKTNVSARGVAKKKITYLNASGHPVYPVRKDGKMLWYCETEGTYTKTWTTRQIGSGE